MNKKTQIGDTPLSISIYSVQQSETMINDRGILKIILCLKGSIKFSYAYEEFQLQAGDFVSVDRDAYYFYDGHDNICVSFYFDLKRYSKRFPFITELLFICEGIEEEMKPAAHQAYDTLRGMLIAILKELTTKKEAAAIQRFCDRIVDMFINSFDINCYYSEGEPLSGEDMHRQHVIISYMNAHMAEKITLADLADEMNLTEGYLSEYIKKISGIGFRGMLSYLRANESERILLYTDKTVVEISEECGFSDVKYYYSAFKKWYKCTPKQFRDKYGQMKIESGQVVPLDSIKEHVDDLLINHYMQIFS